MRALAILLAALLIAAVAGTVADGATSAACASGPCGTADYDGDRIKDWADNCPLAANPTQRDTDKDTPAPVVDTTAPSPVDGQTGPIRVYPATPVQSGQPADTDLPPDKGGDACDADDDGDGIWDRRAAGHKGPDNCRLAANPDQKDSDLDGIGDVCDPTPNGAPQAPAAAAKVKVSVAKTLRFDQVRTGVLVRVSCTAVCQVAGELNLDKQSARRAKLSKTGLKLGQGAAFLGAKGSTWLFVRIPAKSVKNLSKSFKKVRPVLTVMVGDKRVATKRITLKR